MKVRATAPRALAALALLPAGLLAAGCGIQSTDVIAVGGPASLPAAPPGYGTVLYFAGPDGLMPVVREGAAQAALPLLFAGPNKAERDAGLRTELPPFQGPLKMSVEEGVATVALSQDVSGLTPVAQRQIACTVLHAATRAGTVRVTILGTGAKSSLSPLTCPT